MVLDRGRSTNPLPCAETQAVLKTIKAKGVAARHRASQAKRHCWQLPRSKLRISFLRRSETPFTHLIISDQWLFSIGSSNTLSSTKRTGLQPKKIIGHSSSNETKG
ncbi:hypothetical protein NPIL_618071 [Nephila pilipes]|uniref:Uncharacterized protein n=1 Tax=Nephila pilipes TaxID=299642 RepID=A0A8X6T5R1_NEPPI|nr:hypothetical protein NPIL_618071 [Nephila pilipes]